jgi:hypothetical protein
MKKFAVAAVTVLATAAVAVGIASGSGGGGTLIDEGFACGILDGNGNFIAASSSELWYYSNQQQTKLKLKCEGDGAGAPSLTYFNYANTGLTCSVPYGGSTTDWVDKVGRNGNSQLTCSVTFDGDGPDGSASGGAGIG